MQIGEIIHGNVALDTELEGILADIHLNGPVNSEIFEKLAYIKKLYPEVFARYENKLLYLLGLFFKTKEPESIFESIYSIYPLLIADQTGKAFTPIQADAYRKIHSKKYFSFSAPTSSGKSYLFSELIKESDKDIIVVVPSRALIAEYLISIKKLVDKSVLVLPFIENVNRSKVVRRIFVITPERGEELFEVADQLDIGIFLFDEAQISEEHIRGMRFDSFVRRANRSYPDAKKVFTHPFVLNPDAQLSKHAIASEDSSAVSYEQYSVGKIYLAVQGRNFSYFSPFESPISKIRTNEDPLSGIISARGSALIYVSKSKILNRDFLTDFGDYIGLCPRISDASAIRIINELKDFIGISNETNEEFHSIMIEMMERGIVVHHGSLPLAVRTLIERFVNEGHVRICFATSTLIQGINMPFDVVWIDNFHFTGSQNEKRLGLKNLIGRAGRTKASSKAFDYGYVVIRRSSIGLFCERLNEQINLNPTSQLDENINDIDEDLKDIAEAIRSNTFDPELQLTETQVERIKESELDTDIDFILNHFLPAGIPLTGDSYQSLGDTQKARLRDSFRNMFISHLRRKDLSPGEKRILSTAIPIMLWRIQGRSFRQIVAFRHAYLTQLTKRRELKRGHNAGLISFEEMMNELNELLIRDTTKARPIPDSSIGGYRDLLFPSGSRIRDFDFDTLICDTYDYLDKVISISLVNPIVAALKIHYANTSDGRAITLANYIKYGTDDQVEILLQRYGFGFEEISWLRPHIQSITEDEIIFFPSISELDADKQELINRYV